ncbi:Thioredoxin Y1, chloroplastic [Morella rubra]|uniref:Thioredoxin Y1, chloroplastic n=1 Tax=Morella rubra TaxID=262757 RepID=A0A6A1UX87_9ROSI|nr:Thioredoxin Y1, chloroplastic [Morella rubra]
MTALRSLQSMSLPEFGMMASMRLCACAPCNAHGSQGKREMKRNARLLKARGRLTLSMKTGDYPRSSQVFRGYSSVVSASMAVKAKKQTFSSFEDLLANSDKPVLVDFYATWCGPCQFMAPVLNDVSIQLKDKIQVVKIDTEKYPSIADKYRIEALPTFIIFKDGEPYDRFEGALTADQLIQRIENSLKVKQ